MADDPKTAADLIDLAREDVTTNLPSAARDLLTWKRTGTLPDGNLRRIAEGLCAFDEHAAYGIAEALVHNAALEIVANG